MMQGRRRDYQAESEMYKNHSLLFRLWAKMWKFIYAVVAIATYVGMLAGLLVTAYWSYIDLRPTSALIAGLCTVLVVYINKVNPA